MFKKRPKKPGLMVKDLLGELERVEDVKDKVIQQINRRSGMSPMGESFISGSLSASPSISASATSSRSPSPSPFDYMDYSDTRTEVVSSVAPRLITRLIRRRRR